MKADRFYYFLARKKKACSPIAIAKWATNPPSLPLPQETLFKRTSMYVLT